MLPVNTFVDYSPWTDSIETISQLDGIACLFIVILQRKYSQKYNKLYIGKFLTFDGATSTQFGRSKVTSFVSDSFSAL